MNQDAVTAYQDYYRHVELHWSLQRERLIIVSPIEFEAIQTWYEAEVPLPVVLEAISEFVARKKKNKRQRHYLLTHVQDTVAKLFEAWKTLHEGEGEEDGNLLLNKMKALQKKLKKSSQALPLQRPILESVVDALKQINLENLVRFEDVDGEIARLDTWMVDQFKASLGEEELAAIREDVGDFLQEEEDPELFGKMVRDSIRLHFGLPRLTLLG